MNTSLTCSFALRFLLPASTASANPGAYPSTNALYEQGTRQMPPSWIGLGKTNEAAVFFHKEVRKAKKAHVAMSYSPHSMRS